MGRVDFTKENKKATTNYDYPKLKLKSGEKARILLLENPVMEYVHTLRAPQIVNGKPVMFMNERKDKTKFEDYKMDFVSRPLCLGDEAILDKDGSDPKHCPVCKLAKENSDYASAPQRRFAMHVIRYKTNSSNELITPYSVEVLVWAFTDKVFSQIVDFKAEWDDLRKHDITLGPCTNETFQQFDLNIGAKAAWMEDKERQKLTAETFKNNQIPDLAIACGSKKELKWLEEDIEKIRTNWGIAVGAPAEAEKEAELDASLDQDLNSLMDDTSAADASPSLDKTTTDTSTDDLLADLGNLDSGTEDAPTEEKKAETKSADTDVADLDDLLGDL